MTYGVFLLPTGIGLYSNKPHYHLLFVVSLCWNTKSEMAMSHSKGFSISITENE